MRRATEVPIIKKHTSLVHLRADREQDILKLVPIGRVYEDGMLYIDFKNMYGEELTAVLLTNVSLGLNEDNIPVFEWSEVAFPSAYKKALGMFEDMRDGFYDFPVKTGQRYRMPSTRMLRIT